MDREVVRDYCLNKPEAVEDFPFGADVAVFKVMGKMFALMPVTGAVSISLKCEPMLADILRSTFADVTPGYHLNKRHWNSVKLDGDSTIPLDEVFNMIDHSYEQVVKGLPKKVRERLSDGKF